MNSGDRATDRGTSTVVHSQHVREFYGRKKRVGDMPNTTRKVRSNNSRSDRLVFLVVGALIFPTSICSGVAPTQDATEPIWPTKEWQTSSPEEQGMDSKELAKLVDFGTMHNFDSLLVARHGKLVAEACYAPYTQGIPHTVNSVTKGVISTLTAIASKDRHVSDASKDCR